MENSSSDRGPSLITRAAAVLRTLATSGRNGMALTAIARAVDLPNATVHRLLEQLIRERFAMRVEENRHYAIGPLAYELGLAAAERFDIRRLLNPPLSALAAATAETVYLIQRSGNEAVCVDLIEGPSPVRVTTLTIGSRRPLGLGAGGLAILAALPPPEAEAVLHAVSHAISQDWHLSEGFLQQSLARTRETGFAVIRNRIHPDVTAVGRSVRDGLGRVIAAITVAGVNRRMGGDDLPRLQSQLAETALALEDILRSRRWPVFDAAPDLG
jgi:DNA-binding IclR family transcriptional regulator